MTKRLHIDDRHDKESPQLTEKEFLYILSLFPNLKYLDIMRSAHRDHYVEILCNCQSSEILQFLEEIVIRLGYMQDENEVSRVKTLPLCYSFRQSLKNMAVYYTDNLVCGKSLESLVDFQNLSTVDVYDDTNRNMTFFHLLQACPSLSSVSYASTFSSTQSASEQLAKMIQNSKNQNSSISQLFNNLTKVKLIIPSLTQPYINFFTDHSPKSLNHVHLHTTQIGMHKWIHEVQMDVALNLCKSLQKINSVSLIFFEDHTANHENDLPVYQLLAALTGERDFKNCVLVNRECDELNLWDSAGVSIEISGTSLEIEHCLRILDEKVDEDDFDDTFSGLSPTSLQQYSKITKLEKRIFAEEDFFCRTLKRYLEFAKKISQKITKFQFTAEEAVDCCLQAECPSGEQTLQTVTQLSIDAFRYLPDLMSYLPEYFPIIKALSIGLHISPWELLGDDSVNIKLANFKHLNTLSIDTRYVRRDEDRLVFLRYTNSRHLTTHYLLKSKTQKDGLRKHYFKRISPFWMEDQIRNNEFNCTFTMYIEGSPGLKKIVLRDSNKFLAQLNL